MTIPVGQMDKGRTEYSRAAVDLVNVPCNGCRACCHGVIVLHPALRDDPSQYETEEVPGFGMVLKRNPDGSCYYLNNNGCSIWPNTPAVCRAFDCRVYANSKWAELDPLRDEAVIAAGKVRSFLPSVGPGHEFLRACHTERLY